MCLNNVLAHVQPEEESSSFYSGLCLLASVVENNKTAHKNILRQATQRWSHTGHIVKQCASLSKEKVMSVLWQMTLNQSHYPTYSRPLDFTPGLDPWGTWAKHQTRVLAESETFLDHTWVWQQLLHFTDFSGKTASGQKNIFHKEISPSDPVCIRSDHPRGTDHIFKKVNQRLPTASCRDQSSLRGCFQD